MKFVIAGIDVSINFNVLMGTISAQIVIPKGDDKYTEVKVKYEATAEQQITIGVHEATWNKG